MIEAQAQQERERLNADALAKLRGLVDVNIEEEEDKNLAARYVATYRTLLHIVYII